MTNVWFDSNDLSLIPGVLINDHDFNQLPDRDIKIHKIARRDLSIITSAEYSSKEVLVYGIIKDCDRYQAEASLATLKALLQRTNAELKVVQGLETVTYTATMNGLSYRWLGNNIPFTLSFVCSDPIGVDDDITSLINANITTSVASVGVTVEGSFTIEPTINIVISTVTDGTGGQMTITNAVVGQGITLNENFANSDIIIINSKEKIVTHNGVRIDYTGLFPTFAPGSQAIGYVDDFTARDITITGTYRKRFV